jgi:hypothetical protein
LDVLLAARAFYLHYSTPFWPYPVKETIAPSPVNPHLWVTSVKGLDERYFLVFRMEESIASTGGMNCAYGRPFIDTCKFRKLAVLQAARAQRCEKIVHFYREDCWQLWQDFTHGRTERAEYRWQ